MVPNGLTECKDKPADELIYGSWLELDIVAHSIRNGLWRLKKLREVNSEVLDEEDEDYSQNIRFTVQHK